MKLGVAFSFLREDDLRNELKIPNENDIQIILQVYNKILIFMKQVVKNANDEELNVEMRVIL